MRFNINDKVRVKITELGKKIHLEKHNRFCEKFGSNLSPGMRKYTPIKEDDEGWSEWQLWVLMHEFGEHVNWGELPIETTIEIPEAK